MRGPIAACALVGCALAAATAYGHYDHPAPAYAPPSEPASSVINSGGENADWELLATIPTGNPHSDLDLFTVGGDTFASVGTLGTGPNAGGQTIVKLTDKGAVKPSYVSAHPSASCLTGSSSVTGLQHDVEATPKGTVPIPAQPNQFINKGDVQLLVDATDAPGRCHDQGSFGVQQAGSAPGAVPVPQGGLEIIDVTDVTKPKEIALTSHIGQAHTVNIDPKRPHIAFDVTQDGVAINSEGKRANETSGNALDGFEIVDMSSCMNFPKGTAIEVKREKCRPEVYRYRYPEVAISKSHSFNSMQSCHEVEIYPDDTLTCASITATAIFNLKDAFDDRGTPNDYTDDKPRGTPLPCRVRDSSTAAATFKTAAKITDCVTGSVGGKDQPLNVAEWLKIGQPSLEGVKWLGTIPHVGFGATQDIAVSPFDATVDIVAAHETEMTESGNFLITSDERGGATVPPGASCTPGADNVEGNGGLHFFPRKNFTTSPPKTAEAAQNLWARTSKGDKAIFRAPIRTQPQGAFCTAHVFQIIPGQNRIFMGWYTQGTEVLDFVENADGTVDFKEVGYFTPENANTWVSTIFKMEKEADGRFTYYGVTGDGILPGTGRSAIDVYKVTLPAPPTPAGGAKPGGATVTPAKPPAATAPCARTSSFASAAAKPRGRGISFSFAPRTGGAVQVDLFQQSAGRRIVGERRVKAFGKRSGGFRWNGRAAGLRDGIYFARLRRKAPNGQVDTRRFALQRVKGRFRTAPDFDLRRPCGLVDSFKLERPVFGGSGRKAPLRGSFRLGESANVGIEVLRGNKVVQRIKTRMYAAGRTHRVRFAPRGGRGVYRVVLKAQRPGRSSDVALSARRL
jgi:hypothetical protein